MDKRTRKKSSCEILSTMKSSIKSSYDSFVDYLSWDFNNHQRVKIQLPSGDNIYKILPKSKE